MRWNGETLTVLWIRLTMVDEINADALSQDSDARRDRDSADRVKQL